MLLERADAFAALDAALAAVRAGGPGRILSVAGEAGVGKTSLLREFARRDVEVWWGACDALVTPRPLGPLLDMAGSAGGELLERVRSGASRDDLFDATLHALTARTSAVVVIIEDAHWADEATLDLVTYLGRRIDGTRALLLISHRPEDSGPVRTVLGRLALGGDRRIALTALSPASVRAILGPVQADADRVHEVTGGNPFFVTELVAGLRTGAPAGSVPESIADAVAARVAALEPAAQRCLAACAVHAGPLSPGLVAALAGGDAPAVDSCVARGMLVGSADALRFRHELARLAMLADLSPNRRRELHRRALGHLVATAPYEVDRLADHAEQAGDSEAILRFAPLAADRASAVGANRVAATHLACAASVADRLGPAEAATMLERFAAAAAAVGRRTESIDAYGRAARLWQGLGDSRREGAVLVDIGGPLVQSGRQAEALASARRSLALLEPAGASPELTAALIGMCGLHMLARELDAAISWGERAISAATQLGLDDQRSVALIQTGVARLMGGAEDRGLAEARAGTALARETGQVRTVLLGYFQLGSAAGEIGRHDVAEPALRAAISWADEHELVADYPTAWLARCRFELGHWDDADHLASQVLADPRAGDIARCVAGCVLGRLRAARGEADSWTPLDEALAIARRTGHLQRLWPLAAARAEAAWLYGHAEDEVALLTEAADLARALGYARATGELEWWLWRAGARAAAPTGWTAPPWPYEQALLAIDSADPSTLQTAFRRLDELGAVVVLPRIAARLRALGASVPQRVSAAARTHPHGLTRRQAEIADLLGRALTNREIATELYLSEKTVEAHVSAVLAKLGVGSRRDLRR